jgi:hypothetical protein
VAEGVIVLPCLGVSLQGAIVAVCAGFLMTLYGRFCVIPEGDN